MIKSLVELFILDCACFVDENLLAVKIGEQNVLINLPLHPF